MTSPALPRRAARRVNGAPRRAARPARPAAGAVRPAGTALTVADFEALAKAKMPRGAFDYYAGGADDERTLRANLEAFDELWLRPRVLVDVSTPNPSLTLFGEKLSMPVLLAPAALHRLAHPDGELATARAATRAGTIMVVSTIATYSLEEVAKASAGARWFQLYVYRDRALSEVMVRRAEDAGYRALVLTADTPRLGQRLRDLRNAFQIPESLRLANFEGTGLPMTSLGRRGGDRTLTGSARMLLNTSLTWKDVEWLRSLTRMPVLVKGILTAEDARLAVEHGASGHRGFEPRRPPARRFGAGGARAARSGGSGRRPRAGAGGRRRAARRGRAAIARARSHRRDGGPALPLGPRGRGRIGSLARARDPARGAGVGHGAERTADAGLRGPHAGRRSGGVAMRRSLAPLGMRA